MQKGNEFDCTLKPGLRECDKCQWENYQVCGWNSYERERRIALVEAKRPDMLPRKCLYWVMRDAKV